MKNPLNRRVLRELRGDFKKYLAMFLMLALTIGFVSGMFVANDSMLYTLDRSFERYHVEDGHFTLEKEPTGPLLEALEDAGIALYPQPCKDFDEDVDGDGAADALVRVFRVRTDINGICLMEGALPARAGEMAIDRMHADNAGIAVGDTLYLDGAPMTVTGLISRLDYTTLYEDPSDLMFNALTFNIAVVTDQGFEALPGAETWQYAFFYDDPPGDQEAEKPLAEETAERLAVLAATGGLYDDLEAAEAFSKEAEEFAALAEQLEAAQALADALETDPSPYLDPEKTRLLETAQELMAQAETDPALLLDPDNAALLQAAQELMAQAETDPMALLLPETRQRLEEAQALLEDVDQDQLTAMADQLTYLDENRNQLTEFVPRYVNPAIWFAPDDMRSDKSMGLWILLVLVLVLAFIFAITAANTIAAEATAIGTLRASGYTRGELLRHYLAPPILVTLLAALAGNLLGYTVFKEVVVGMYYNSYSLPTYVTRWNADAFVNTTVLPVLLVVAVQVAVIHRRLRLSPLKFLRGDLTVSRRRRALRLPDWRFLRRFRARILLRNLSSYLVLFAGICFVMLLLCFAMGMPATLSRYEDLAADMMFARYQYVLKDTQDADGTPVTTAVPGAEPYAQETLETVDGVHVGEEITVYGYQPGSAYIDLPGGLGEGEAYISAAYADKFGLEPGDQIVLKERFSRRQYAFRVAAVYGYDAGLAALLPLERFNQVFDRDPGSFTGYLSDQPLDDIDGDMIYTVVTQEAILKMVHQLQHSMGDYMNYFSVACALIAALILYLLTKIIIEKDAVSISMVKVLGYTDREVSGLYVRLTSAAVAVSAVAGLFVGRSLVVVLWAAIMREMNGWFTFYIGPLDMVKCVLLVLLAYGVVACFDLRRIRRVPLTEALKTVE